VLPVAEHRPPGESLRRWFGVPADAVSGREQLVSGLGACLALLAVIAISQDVLGLHGAAMLIASTGATAVLLFGVPHGVLSQPWPVVGGHVVSASIGVACSRAIDNRTLAGALALGLALGTMHRLRCVHPPGGATALSAVFGGPAVAQLGYSYVLRPVLLNVVTITVMAVLFNAMFPWRRYPAFLARTAPRRPAPAPVTHEQLRAALRSVDSFVDISEDDLAALHRRLSEHEEP